MVRDYTQPALFCISFQSLKQTKRTPFHTLPLGAMLLHCCIAIISLYSFPGCLQTHTRREGGDIFLAPCLSTPPSTLLGDPLIVPLNGPPCRHNCHYSHYQLSWLWPKGFLVLPGACLPTDPWLWLGPQLRPWPGPGLRSGFGL